MAHQSGVQGLFQDIRPVKRRHVEHGRRRSDVAAGGRVALIGHGGGGHERWRALVVVLTVALLIQRQGQALPFLPPIAEPNTHHLPNTPLVYTINPQKKTRKREVSYISFQAQLVCDLCDFLSVWFGTLDEEGLQSWAHRSLKAGPPLPLSCVDKNTLNLVHLRNHKQHFNKDKHLLIKSQFCPPGGALHEQMGPILVGTAGS